MIVCYMLLKLLRTRNYAHFKPTNITENSVQKTIGLLRFNCTTFLSQNWSIQQISLFYVSLDTNKTFVGKFSIRCANTWQICR